MKFSLPQVVGALIALAVVLSIPASADVPVTMGVQTQKASAFEVFEAANQPLEADPEKRYVSSAAGTTPIDIIASDPLSAETAASDPFRQTVRYSQEVTIENMSATQSVCMCSTTHALTCAALTCACRTGAGAPNLVPPGKSLKRRYAGTRKLCVAATAAAAEYQVERVISKVGAR